MTKNENKKQVTFYMDLDTFNRFKEKYPNVTTFFLTRCIVKALNDVSFFEKIFFSEEK